MKLRHTLGSIVLPLSMVAAALASTGCDDDHRHHSRGQYGGLACVDGVGINLDGLTDVFAKALPLTVTVCFDKSCDEVTLYDEGDGLITCDGKEGGAPDQLTYCEPGESGLLRFEIVRTDGADYSDGTTHIIGVSVRTGDKLLWTGAQGTTLSTDVDGGGLTCHQDNIDFTPDAGPIDDGSGSTKN